MKQILLVILLTFSSAPGFWAYAQSTDTPLRSASARKAFAATQRFFKAHPLLEANYLPANLTSRSIQSDRVISYAIDGEGTRITRLNTVLNGLVDFGRALSWKTDSNNFTRTYRLLYAKLPKKFRKGLKSPRDLQTSTMHEKILAYNKFARKLETNFQKILIELRPGVLESITSNPIAECALALGYESAGFDSENSGRCDTGEYEPLGLMRNVTFPLKDNLTCVKDQGRRGTCSAHAISAAVESMNMVDGGPVEDLSEQYTYYYAETEGDSQVSQIQTQQYGSSVSYALAAFVSLRLGFYYESAWNYNRSSLLDASAVDPVTLVLYYDGSCSNLYTGEECSEYPFQSVSNIVGIGQLAPGAPPALPATKVHTIRSTMMLVGIGAGNFATDTALQSAILMLAADTPVVVTFAATENFTDTTDGFVRSTPGDAVLGSHAVEVVGFVPNANLPQGVTPAQHEGYFIAKNSWSTSGGDCGFYYLEYDYLRDHAYYIDVFELR